MCERVSPQEGGVRRGGGRGGEMERGGGGGQRSKQLQQVQSTNRSESLSSASRVAKREGEGGLSKVMEDDFICTPPVVNLFGALADTATCGNILHHTATHCTPPYASKQGALTRTLRCLHPAARAANTARRMQHRSVNMPASPPPSPRVVAVKVLCCVLCCVVLCCVVLVCCSVLQCVAVCCSVLQRVAVWWRGRWCRVVLGCVVLCRLCMA